MREDPRPATVDQRQASHREPRRHRCFVRAVRVHDGRARASRTGSASRTGQANHVVRHECSVGGGGPLTDALVARQVDVGCGCPLEHHTLGRVDVVFPHGRRRHQALGGEAHPLGAPLGIRVEFDVVRRLAEVDIRRRSIAPHDAQTRLSSDPLVNHEMRNERVDPRDAITRAVWNELGPLIGRLGRCRHHSEVDGIEIGEDDEPIAPMIEVILEIVGARANDTRCIEWCSCRDQPRLARGLRVGVDDDPFAVAREVDAHVEALIGFVEDLHVVGLRGAEAVTPNSRGPLLLVVRDVEQVVRIGTPSRSGPRGVPDFVGQIGASGEIAHVHREVLTTVDVERPREQRCVGAHVERTQGEVLVSTRLGVLVEDHGLGRGLA